ncbi:MAG: ADP-ribosylglycohydrolase family protein [Halobacteriaceae archaeon]
MSRDESTASDWLADPAAGIDAATPPDRLPAPLFLSRDHATLAFEVQQLEDAGRDLGAIESLVTEARNCEPDDSALAPLVTQVLDEGQRLPIRADFAYEEPTEREAVEAARPDERPGHGHVPPAAARAAIHGGWVGACAGCLLGKPVQGWARHRIEGFLRESEQWPLTEYMHAEVPEEVATTYDIHSNLEPIDAFIDEVSGMPIDDDIDYPVLGVEVLQEHGPSFTTLDIGNAWLERLPLMNTYTAERVAYRNLAALRTPPETATHRNPYREMVGAMIRADPWGFVALGNPDRAAEFAHRDARLSHVKNGIYAARWAAAMIAAAPLVESVSALLDAGLGQVPEKTRLTEAVETVRDWHGAGLSAEAAIDRVHERWDESDTYDWVHAISNAEVLTIGLLWSEGDFAEAITTAVAAGFDTDSHAATLGAILGTYHGVAGIPERFVTPLADTVATSLPSRCRTSISTLARETYEVWSTRSA